VSNLSSALYHELRPEFFRVLCSEDSRIYVDALDALERAFADAPRGIERDDAVAIVEQAVDQAGGGDARERARTALDYLESAGWIESEQGNDWQRSIHFHPNGQAMMLTLRRLAFPEGVSFSDKLVNVCTTLANRDALTAEPWAQVESCVALLQAGIAELRRMQKDIERHTRHQLSVATMRENLSVLFDQFAERIGHACYAELVHSRLPLRLAEARRAVSELGIAPDLMEKMQGEVMRREPAVSAESVMTRVRLRLDELEQLLESVVPVADAVDRRTAEFTRRSLARFRYLQETTSESRAQVQAFFEALNQHGAGRRVVELDDEAAEFSALKIHDARLFGGLESLCTPRLQRSVGEIAAMDDEATEGEREDAMRRVQAALRDSLTVARANRFVDDLLPPQTTSISSAEIPLRCDEDIADLIACLLHARAADARYRVVVPAAADDAAESEFDSKLNRRFERFTLSRK
jgi:hypothetical protein